MKAGNSRILVHLALAALVIPNFGSATELTRIEWFPPGYSTAGKLLETFNGDVLVSVGNSGPPSVSVASGLYRMRSDGTLADKVVLPANIFMAVPFADGFVATRPFGPRDEYGLSRYQVVTANGRSTDSLRVLYESDPNVNSIHAKPSLTHEAVYVVTDLRQYRFAVQRIDAAGAVSWHVPFQNAQFIDVVSIPGGVALFYYPHRAGKPGLLPVQVAALSDSGALRWRSSYVRPARMAIESLAFQPPDQLVGLQVPSSLQGSWQLWRMAIDDGTVLAAIEVPPASYMRPTPAGLLLTDNLAQQPYAALVKRDGSLAWWRRFPIHPEHGGRLVDATITPTGQLLVLGDYAVQREHQPSSSDTSVVLLRTDANRPAATPGCLSENPSDIVNLQRRIEFRHAIEVAVSRGAARYQIANPPCQLPSDSSYLQFLRELDTSLGPQTTQPPRWDLRIYLAVRDIERDYLMTGYAMSTGVLHAPRTSVRYSVKPGAARAVGTHLSENVWPHLRSMEALQERFRQLTGCALMIQLQDPKLSDVQIFRGLEAAAAKVIAAIEEIAPAHLRNPRESARRELYPRLEVDGFGKHDDVRPLEDVRATVRKLFYVD